MMAVHFRNVIAAPSLQSSGLATALEQFEDVGPDAQGDLAAAARRGMSSVPGDGLLARRFRRPAMGPVPLLVQGHGPLADYIALTMFSVTFLASPSSIMVLSR